MQTYTTVQQQLPSDPTIESFSSANQVGVAQLAIQYCNVAVTTPALLQKLLPGVTLNGSLYSTQAGIDSVTSALAARVLSSGLLATQPAGSTLTGANGELDKMIVKLCTGSVPCANNVARTTSVTAAACAAALGSADMLIN